MDSLPKDLGTGVNYIKLSPGTYHEKVGIYGFQAGGLDYGLCICGTTDSPDDVLVDTVDIRSNSAVISLQNLSIVLPLLPILNIGNSAVLIDNVAVSKKAASQEGSYGTGMVNIFGFASAIFRRVVVDGHSDCTGIKIFGNATFGSAALSVKNCTIGIAVGDGTNNTCGIAMIYDQPTFEGNTTDIVKGGIGSIATGLEG